MLLKRYKLIAGGSFLVLFSILLYLIYNTYELKYREYFSDTKSVFRHDYHKFTEGDVIFPGSVKIIRDILNPEMDKLEHQYINDTNAFNKNKQLICKKLFDALRASSSLDNIVNIIIRKNKLNKQLRYLFTIYKIEVDFSDSLTMSLYNSSIHYPLITDSIQTKLGVIIDGDLSTPNEKNNILSAEITSNNEFIKYDIGVGLYVDYPSHYLYVLWKMLPVFILSIVVITIIVTLYYFAYKNWITQKNLSDIKSDFIDNVTHEINTPLSAVIVANKNLQNAEILTDKEQIFSISKLIERQAQILKMLFERVFFANGMSHLDLNKKRYFIGELIEELILDYKLSFTRKNLNIHVFKEQHDFEVELDKFLFTSIVFNIFQNAVKYNKSETKVIDLSIVGSEEYIEIKIKDNGIGMEKNVLQHIYEKSYRAKNELTENISGFGLGLYYAKNCVLAHGWKINVESTVDVGSTFIIEMPFININE